MIVTVVPVCVVVVIDMIIVKRILNVGPRSNSFVMLKQENTLNHDNMRCQLVTPSDNNLVAIIIVEVSARVISIIEAFQKHDQRLISIWARVKLVR